MLQQRTVMSSAEQSRIQSAALSQGQETIMHDQAKALGVSS
jgi:hypothetical protein